MEAIAKHDFSATADDELSFRKSQILKVSKYQAVKYMRKTMKCIAMSITVYMSVGGRVQRGHRRLRSAGRFVNIDMYVFSCS